jgi:hypothetical protein
MDIYISIGVTWVITLGGGKGGISTMGITNFNLRRSQVRNNGKIGLNGSNQSLIYIHPFAPLPPNFFICHSWTQEPPPPKKILGSKNYCNASLPKVHLYTHMTLYLQWQGPRIRGSLLPCQPYSFTDKRTWQSQIMKECLIMYHLLNLSVQI